MSLAKELYPDYDGGYGPGSYQPIIDYIGEVLVQEDSGDYQGDTFAMVRHREGGHYGFLFFGWGSCSGCDAIQACDSVKELDDLIDGMVQSVIWVADTDAALSLLEDKTQELKWYSHTAEWPVFVEKCKKALVS